MVTMRNVCRYPFQCSHCLKNGHHERECHNSWRPLSSLACLAAPLVSCLGVGHRQAPAYYEGPMGCTVPRKAPCGVSWASVVAAPTGLISPSDVVLHTISCAGFDEDHSYVASSW
jgi:hypothetical protein